MNTGKHQPVTQNHLYSHDFGMPVAAMHLSLVTTSLLNTIKLSQGNACSLVPSSCEDSTLLQARCLHDLYAAVNKKVQGQVQQVWLCSTVMLMRKPHKYLHLYQIVLLSAVYSMFLQAATSFLTLLLCVLITLLLGPVCCPNVLISSHKQFHMYVLPVRAAVSSNQHLNTSSRCTHCRTLTSACLVSAQLCTHMLTATAASACLCTAG